MKINRSNQQVRASVAKNKTKNFIAGGPDLARTLGKVSLALSIFYLFLYFVPFDIIKFVFLVGLFESIIPPDYFLYVFLVPLFMSIIIGCIGFVLSIKKGKINLFAVIGIISSLGCIVFDLLFLYGLSRI